MGRATNKIELLENASINYDKLITLINSMSGEELNTPFDFTNHEKKKEAHWGRDKNLRDIIIHLYEWHQLILNWVSSNMNGKAQTFIPAPYNWKTYGDMNILFWEKHQQTSLDDAKKMFNKSHKEVIELADTFTNEVLFSKNVYPWVGGSTLGSYFTSTTSSHYDWAMKKIKAHRKNCKQS